MNFCSELGGGDGQVKHQQATVKRLPCHGAGSAGDFYGASLRELIYIVDFQPRVVRFKFLFDLCRAVIVCQLVHIVAYDRAKASKLRRHHGRETCFCEARLNFIAEDAVRVSIRAGDDDHAVTSREEPEELHLRCKQA